jgi:2-polyprenyl-6-methoxyphenol hydroxylase-like FAD-dependent oxidoreductase
MSALGERAVVLGAGMAGLLAARVVSEFYETVTLVERDVLPSASAQRRGVPHGRHLHALLSSGSHALDRLFPGLLDDLVAAGANVCDEGNLSRVSMRVGGHELNRSGTFAEPSALVLYIASRPLLESHVRQRVRAIDNVSVLDGHDVVEPIADQPHRVTGARVANRETGAECVLEADLVIDATGRGAPTPAFLETLGYGRPKKQRSAMMPLSYSSQLLRIPPGTIKEKVTCVFPVRTRSTYGALLAYEHGTWIMAVGCLAGQQPPADRADMIVSAEQFAPPPLLAALRAAEPLSEVSIYRYPASVWRRYDKMRRFPAGLLVLGDAICSLNPIYGQGMSVAALEAVALRDCLARGDADLSRRFFRAAAKQVGWAWAANRRRGWMLTQSAKSSSVRIEGRHSLSMWFANWCTDKLLTAAEEDIVITEAFFRVLNLVDPPNRMLHPAVMIRLLTANRRRGEPMASVAPGR